MMLECSRCLKIFSSGFSFGPGTIINMRGNVSLCPFCGSPQSTPDGTFRATVEGFTAILKNSSDPLKEAEQLLEKLESIKTNEDLEGIKKSSSLKKFKRWLPDTPEKIAAYIAIVYTFIQILTSQPRAVNNYNVFVKQYNQTVINIQR